jgi:hypothetical protein
MLQQVVSKMNEKDQVMASKDERFVVLVAASLTFQILTTLSSLEILQRMLHISQQQIASFKVVYALLTVFVLFLSDNTCRCLMLKRMIDIPLCLQKQATLGK